MFPLACKAGGKLAALRVQGEKRALVNHTTFSVAVTFVFGSARPPARVPPCTNASTPTTACTRLLDQPPALLSLARLPYWYATSPQAAPFREYFNPGYVVVENVPGILRRMEESGLDKFIEVWKAKDLSFALVLLTRLITGFLKAVKDLH